MLFNSVEYLFFFPTVVILYFLLPLKWRMMMLLAASYYFYMCWKVEYIILIILSTLTDFYAAQQIKKSTKKSTKKRWLWLSLGVNLGILFGFKYFNFFNESVQSIFNTFNLFYGIKGLEVLLPVGISFYTFQTLSYTIDVYNEKIDPEKSLSRFALYVSFFPQLVAGPIERPTNLLPQFKQKIKFSVPNLTYGTKLIIWGLFKKVVIADRLASYVDAVYGNHTEFGALTSIIATIFFAFQIYCDFSGYSDIAIGSARILGINLMENFRTPYLSKGIREFWSRWHISLSTWFRDYLYIPLGGNRVVKWRWYYNLMITFLVSGLWHGANWTFVFWGFLHGLYLIIENQFSSKGNSTTKKPSLYKNTLQILFTFSLVTLAWVFFRASNVNQAFDIIGGFITKMDDLSIMMISKLEMAISVFFLGFLILIEIYANKTPVIDKFDKTPIAIRWAFYYTLLLATISFGVFADQEFIYFQF